jgi:hypothetical protein
MIWKRKQLSCERYGNDGGFEVRWCSSLADAVLLRRVGGADSPD